MDSLLLRGLWGVLMMGVLAASSAQQTPTQIKRTVLHRADVPQSSYEVMVFTAEVPSGYTAGKHTHPGTVVGYILEGEYTLLVEGEAPRVLKAGESLTIPPGVVHDERTGQGAAKFLAVFTVQKGKPLSTPVK